MSNFRVKYRVRADKFYQKSGLSNVSLLFLCERKIAFMNKTKEEMLLYISRLESILDNLPFEVWFKDLNGKYLIVNQKIGDYFKVKKEDLIGKTDHDIYPKAFADDYVGSDKALLSGRYEEFYQYDLWGNTYEDYKKPAFDETGAVVGITGYSKNMTEFKQAREELLHSGPNQTMLVSNMPGIAFRCANDGNYTVEYLSEGCFDLTGYTAEELMSGNPYYNDLIQPEYRKALKEKWDTEEKNVLITTDEYPIRTRSGETKWVMEQSLNKYDENQCFAGSEGFIIDITRKKLAEEALKQSEERFRTIFEEAPVGVAIFNSITGDAYQVNARYAEIVGRAKEDLTDAHLEDYSFPDELKEIQHKIELLNTNKITSFSLERRLIKPDNSIVWVHTTIAPFYFEEGYNSPRLLCMIEDITDRRKAQEEILYLSYYDQLTGLYNRRFYVEELRRIDVERNLPITLVMADVNGLKLTNDAFGHQAGDRLLQYIADTFKNQCRADDIIARVGGDEFILLLPKTAPDQAEKLINRIKAAITEDKSHPVVCSVSFGWDTKKDPAEEIDKIYTNAEDLMYRHKLSESNVMRNDTISLIIKTLFEKYKREEKHARRVSRLCSDTAKALGMNSEDVKELSLAGLVHNIGYIGIRDELLRNGSVFSDAERKEMERHSEIGYQLLRSTDKFSDIAEYILYHHEKVDGKGYPSRSAVSGIPLQSRVIAIADAYDAMTNERQYREKLSIGQAVAEIRKNAGTQFDGEIAEVFIRKVLKEN